jgi:hypothetical protein
MLTQSVITLRSSSPIHVVVVVTIMLILVALVIIVSNIVVSITSMVKKRTEAVDAVAVDAAQIGGNEHFRHGVGVCTTHACSFKALLGEERQGVLGDARHKGGKENDTDETRQVAASSSSRPYLSVECLGQLFQRGPGRGVQVWWMKARTVHLHIDVAQVDGIFSTFVSALCL